MGDYTVAGGAAQARVRELGELRRKRQRVAALLLALAALVAAGVFWQLHSTGIALSNEALCGMEEHQHTEACYGEDGALSCGLEEHVHTAECYADGAADGVAEADAEDTQAETAYEGVGQAAESGEDGASDYGVSLASDDGTSAADDDASNNASGYAFTYNWNFTTGNWQQQQQQSYSGSEEYTIYIVDTDGTIISSSNVTATNSAPSYSQTNSNDSYSLSALAENFTVTVNGTSYTYKGAYLDGNLSTSVTSIRYGSSNNSNYSMQYQSSSSSGYGNNNWSTLSSTTIYLVYKDASQVETSFDDYLNSKFTHIDVKVALAESDSSTVDYTLYKVTSITTYSDYSNKTVANSETDNSTRTDGEWSYFKHDFYGSYTIVITYTVSYVEDGETKYKNYTAVLDASSTYADGTYYPASGDCAYKLYNYLYGTSYTSNDQLSSAGITQIDVSGMSIYLVAAILCNNSTVSSQSLTKTDGLDFALDVGTLMKYSAHFDLEVQKNYNADMTDGQFSFTLSEATVSGETWTIGNTLQTKTNGAATASDGSSTSTIDFDQITYESGETEGTATYYYIVRESVGDNSAVTYDATVYGVEVVVKVTKSTSGTNTTIYTSTVESITYYELMAGEDGSYTVKSELTGEAALNTNSDGTAIFPFTNTYSSSTGVTIKKVDEDGCDLSGATFTLKNNSTEEYYSYASSTGTWSTVADGGEPPTISLGSLEVALSDGDYILTETAAPDGYNLLGESITLTVKNGEVTATYGTSGSGSGVVEVVTSSEDGSIVVTVINSPGTVLPNTGGSGTVPYALAGLALCGGAGALLLNRRKVRA